MKNVKRYNNNFLYEEIKKNGFMSTNSNINIQDAKVKAPAASETKKPTELKCKGPRFKRYYCCSSPVMVLAYITMTYTIASVCYILMTRNIGRPFFDSLTEEQMEIKNQSKIIRAKVFLLSVVVASVFLCTWQPFSDEQ